MFCLHVDIQATLYLNLWIRVIAFLEFYLIDSTLIKGYTREGVGDIAQWYSTCLVSKDTHWRIYYHNETVEKPLSAMFVHCEDVCKR